MKIPCKDCLILPVCKNKNFSRLFNECRKIRIYVRFLLSRRNTEAIYDINEILGRKLVVSDDFSCVSEKGKEYNSIIFDQRSIYSERIPM